jgi:hypothetical protein
MIIQVLHWLLGIHLSSGAHPIVSKRFDIALIVSIWGDLVNTAQTLTTEVYSITVIQPVIPTFYPRRAAPETD